MSDDQQFRDNINIMVGSMTEWKAQQVEYQRRQEERHSELMSLFEKQADKAEKTEDRVDSIEAKLTSIEKWAIRGVRAFWAMMLAGLGMVWQCFTGDA